MRATEGDTLAPKAGNEAPELDTLMLCVNRLTIRSLVDTLKQCEKRLAMRTPELATLMLCMKRLATRDPELGTLMLRVKRLATRAF